VLWRSRERQNKSLRSKVKRRSWRSACTAAVAAGFGSGAEFVRSACLRGVPVLLLLLRGVPVVAAAAVAAVSAAAAAVAASDFDAEIGRG
jgi:hypothetical protein